MKTKQKHYMAVVAFAAVAATVPAIQAQTILAPAGVNLGLTGEIIQSPVIHEPSQNAVGWSQTGWNFANRIVPVGQFMGFEDDGTAIPALDLIPFRSTSYTIVNPVTGVATPVPTSASNGLSAVGSDIQLGGTLTQATNISQAGFDFNFYGANVGFRPAGVSNNLFILAGNTPTSPRIFSYAPIELQTGNNINQLALALNGNVGIGTANPTQAKLSVIGNYVGGNIGYAAGNYTAMTTTTVGTTAIVTAGPLSPSIYATGDIVSSATVRAHQVQAIAITTSSDQRIKDVRGISDSSDDLKTLNKIRITEYTLKDKKLQKSAVTKKVIAQEVESVFPNAVSKTNDKLPDVMQVATVAAKENGKVELELPSATDLKVGEKISVLDENDTPTVTAIEKVEGQKISVSLSDVKTGDKRFVYGRQVDDFRTVDYDAISMLNVSATQELAKKVAALESENAELKKIAVEMKELKALVAALEGRSNETVAVSLTK